MPTTTPKHRLALASVLLLATAWANLAHGAEPQRCATVPDDTARLACYDAVFGAPVKASPAAPGNAVPAVAATAATVGAGAVSAAAPSKEEQFGLAPVEAKKKVVQPEEVTGPESIDSVLTALTKRPTGEFIYTLENGQRWVQVEADSSGKLEPGAAVTIRKAALGSYKLLSGPVATRVRRIQ